MFYLFDLDVATFSKTPNSWWLLSPRRWKHLWLVFIVRSLSTFYITPSFYLEQYHLHKHVLQEKEHQMYTSTFMSTYTCMWTFADSWFGCWWALLVWRRARHQHHHTQTVSSLKAVMFWRFLKAYSLHSPFISSFCKDVCQLKWTICGSVWSSNKN